VGEKMTKTEKILQEAEQWVAGINKYFNIKQTIIVSMGTNKRLMSYYARTLLPPDNGPIEIHLYPHKGKKSCPLFNTIFHEMTHILLWPLTKDNPENSPLDKAEEKIVRALEKIFAKISER
jgi:hypothetical protein